MNKKEIYIRTFLRIGLGWIFLWSFIDKLFGLGFTTTADKAWLVGGSPTSGFLKFGTEGPFSSVFQSLSGSIAIDWIFMIGLLLIGITLILGIGIKISSYSGSLMLFLIWLAVLPPEHNPFLDEHIIYILVLIGLSTTESDRNIGLNKWWGNTKMVKRFPILK